MRVLVQRSLKSSVSINNEVVGSIDKGLVLLVGFTESDDSSKIDYLVNKVLNTSEGLVVRIEDIHIAKI